MYQQVDSFAIMTGFVLFIGRIRGNVSQYKSKELVSIKDLYASYTVEFQWLEQ